MNTTVTIREDLKKWAQENNINLSKLLENGILEKQKENMKK
ncbi:type II toxin-antitoxin system CcdA family antitoxin [Enterococcus dispar]|nr:type II toxin-antitoxin system CcdA family antitoxin [Enterococcus dispar]WCG33357.1 type II toxin-antitoxin system CcdA family antitoxin [Enterococcus dispar]